MDSVLTERVTVIFSYSFLRCPFPTSFNHPECVVCVTEGLGQTVKDMFKDDI